MKKLILIAVLPAIVIYISIPFVAKYIVSEPEEAGEIFILHETITNKYIKNAKSGTLLVVTGKVRNDYSDKRNHIKITGKLFSENIKQPSSQAAAYCGNILTESELSTLDLKAIHNRLSNQSGDNNSNINIMPGNIVDFMVVFSKLPKNIKEYIVEVSGSSPALE